MESRYYTCKYCFKEFEPKRRRVQKYCSDTCRNKAHHARKEKTTLPATTQEALPEIKNKPETLPKSESMTLSGVGNATAGSLLADGIKSLLTKEGNKTAKNRTYKSLSLCLRGLGIYQ